MHLPVPLRGVISAPFRAFGVRPSRMNPNTCTICELMFTKVMRARKITIDATVMFADLRGYTNLSQSRSAGGACQACSTHSMMKARTRSGSMMGSSTRRSATPLWRFSTSAGGVMTMPGMPCSRHGISRRNGAKGATALAATLGLDAGELGIGIGIHAGELSFGEFGRSHRDLTAIGTVVNTASRAQSVAEADQILVTEAVYQRTRSDMQDSRSEELPAQGIRCSDRTLRRLS